MSEMFELVDSRSTNNAVLRVIGVGGGGGNTVNQMVEQGIEGVEFICANTDAQHLKLMKAPVKIQLGGNVTRGLGAGADPAVGKQAATEDRDRIKESLIGTDMLFITAGMGGGTGTGAAPVIAEIARELDILTVAVVTKPFSFERGKRMSVAKAGLEELGQFVDSLIVIPNDKLLSVLGRTAALKQAYKAANDVLQNAVTGIADLIVRPGTLNVDFADVSKVMSVKGMAMMGIGAATGENRAHEAADQALSSPLLEDLALSGAEGILVNVAANEDNLSIEEFSTIAEYVSEKASDSAEVIVGQAFDPTLKDEIRVTVVATGLGNTPAAPSVVTPIRPDSNGNVRYDELDTPAVNRQQQPAPAAPPQPMPRQNTVGMDVDLDYLDVPAFLRNQAD